ncbi:MAG TPA: Ni/Fe-hydrogenase cytochrome b subunit [Candidatus Limnocylindria bacterium]|nr:Ni/Fe-hydrogenase cytochrome b subunit [Candidatus Limnocylindria bacterium]
MTTEPVGGPLFTRPFKVLAAFVALGIGVVVWRLVVGLGPTTALSDGYPWGLWISFDVLVGTALGCGGYAVAILVYVLNKGKYHALVRPAILTSALGYSLAGFAIVIDVGRWWNLWKVPVAWKLYNLSSVLLEVALCIMAYVAVLWIELSPMFLERLQESGPPRIRQMAGRVKGFLEKALLWIIALGLLLPTMHQSSLGALFLIAVTKLHPLWLTPWLPLLFLISVVGMGYAVVVFESTLATHFLRRRQEIEMLSGLSVAVVITTALYLFVRLYDLAYQEHLALAFSADLYAAFFWLEMALFVAPMVILASRRRRSNPGWLFFGAMLMLLAGGLYRFDTSLIAYNPGAQWSYFPSVPELLVTLGFLSLEIMAYVYLIKRFPILAGGTAKPPEPAIPSSGAATTVAPAHS